MKVSVIAIVGLLSISGALAAQKRTPAAARGTCSAAALTVAEEEYGNAPESTHITAKPNQYYVVTVGIGNAEDGAHTYLVKCQSPAEVNCGCNLVHEVLPKSSK